MSFRCSPRSSPTPVLAPGTRRPHSHFPRPFRSRKSQPLPHPTGKIQVLPPTAEPRKSSPRSQESPTPNLTRSGFALDTRERSRPGIPGDMLSRPELGPLSARPSPRPGPRGPQPLPAAAARGAEAAPRRRERGRGMGGEASKGSRGEGAASPAPLQCPRPPIIISGGSEGQWGEDGGCEGPLGQGWGRIAAGSVSAMPHQPSRAGGPPGIPRVGTFSTRGGRESGERTPIGAEASVRKQLAGGGRECPPEPAEEEPPPVSA
ncbi:uncharacterized protein LOC144365445 [Ictidomys tridecemlineatus]